MNILLAFDKFKGSLTSAEAAEAAKRGIAAVCGNVRTIVVPTADGGEGTVEAMLSALGGEHTVCSVTPPHCTPDSGETIDASYGILPDGTCIMEMTAASGLALVPEHNRNPLHTSTYGTGEMIRHALDHGAKRILLGIGGSATNDGGCGMAAALGAKFYDADGTRISCPTGGDLVRTAKIDLSSLDRRLSACDITACCDVDTPLCGAHGAAAVYAPQKGASASDIHMLDAGLSCIAALLYHDYGMDIIDVPGAGAAGGLGGGVLAFLGGRLTPGIDAVMDAAGVEAHLQTADLLLTGEGKIDAQTVHGKTVCGLLSRAQAAGVPALVFGGCVEKEADALYSMGAAGIFALCDRPMTIEASMARAEELLTARVRAAVSCFFAGRNNSG